MADIAPKIEAAFALFIGIVTTEGVTFFDQANARFQINVKGRFIKKETICGGLSGACQRSKRSHTRKSTHLGYHTSLLASDTRKAESFLLFIFESKLKSIKDYVRNYLFVLNVG